jgi:inner membrane protein
MTDASVADPVAADPAAEPTEAPPQAASPRETLSMHKALLIAGLAVATVLPNLFISNLIDEREQRQAGVQKEFTRNWGPEQTLYGPILVVPYQAGQERPRQHIKIASARLDLAASLSPQERKRGLFHATVYDAKVEMQGFFLVPSEQKLRDYVSDKDGRFLWNESFVAFGTASSLTGLRASDNIALNGAETQWQPCREAARHERACQNAALVLADAPLEPVATSVRLAFKSTVSLRGTSAFNVMFGGKEMNATVTSPWKTPSFSGDVLPASATVSADGFEARWETVEFGSPRVTASPAIPDAAMWKGATIGVDLLEATPIYRMISRVAKYGLLFVVLSFATYLFFELLSRLQIHIVQYGLLGLSLSLSLFSLLLLSLSEPIGYTPGYAVAASLVLAQASLYTAAVTKRARPTLAFAAMLSCLFAFLYVLLGLETYSLLIGALALFAVVSALMIVTQWVNWGAWRESAAAQP